MKAIILGAGRIGRGFISQILIQNDFDIVFFDNSVELVNSLNKQKQYIIHVMGYPKEDTNITHVRAYSISDIKSLSTEWQDADFIMIAVGGKNLPSVGKQLAKSFKLRLASGNIDKPSNIITCENWIEPAKDLIDAIHSYLTSSERIIFDHNVGVTEAVILTTGTNSPDGKEPINPCDTWVQNFKYLPIDISRMKHDSQNPIKPFKYIEFIDNFGDLLKQKLYTNNTSVALIAFLGYLKGYRYVADAANDLEIEQILDQLYLEINDALIEGLHVDAQSQFAFAKRAKQKYQDRNIVDLITRIARDPIRKLRPDDRLIGPAKILLNIGKIPKAMSLAIAAALYYDYSGDEVAVKLSRIRKTKGVNAILTTISNLTVDDPLVSQVHKAIEQLKTMGWIKEEK